MIAQENAFSVSFVGMDGLDHSTDCSNLEAAQNEATWLEERGCHTITITDVDGNEWAR